MLKYMYKERESILTFFVSIFSKTMKTSFLCFNAVIPFLSKLCQPAYAVLLVFVLSKKH